MSDEALLAVEDLHAAYQSGIDILQGLSLGVRPKSLTLVIGPNGAGKSTLLRAIFGFLKPHAGSIRFRGEPISALDPFEVKARGIGYVPQEINTFPHLTVEENLRMGGWIFRRDKARLARQMARVYEIFPPLAERRRMRASDLSGGQGRMLSVAREMMTEPALLLVDEPTAGLAPNLVDQVYALLMTARQTIGSTILLVDQNIEQAVAHADHVYMVNLGRIKAEGPACDFPPERIAALIQECLLG
ncbi:MAG TPA: ABC transporter ATP-binding protein [Stellaceae bacterium]|jgi:ABC-type branched-subunit amino acid transport system ATPase component|nr:ABC transporter ATP-binding protein [Stellaceae bacterium]